MIVELHGDRVGGRAVGKPRTLVAGSRGDPTTVGGLARMAMLSRVWKLTHRSATTTPGPTTS
jgi:hypothetical protein